MAMEQARQGADRITGVPNVTYDLVTCLHHKLDSIAAMEMYKHDAHDAGQREAESFFDECQKSERSQIERLRAILGKQMQSGTPWTGMGEGVVRPAH